MLATNHISQNLPIFSGKMQRRFVWAVIRALRYSRSILVFQRNWANADRATTLMAVIDRVWSGMSYMNHMQRAAETATREKAFRF